MTQSEFVPPVLSATLGSTIARAAPCLRRFVVIISFHHKTADTPRRKQCLPAPTTTFSSCLSGGADERQPSPPNVLIERGLMLSDVVLALKFSLAVPMAARMTGTEKPALVEAPVPVDSVFVLWILGTMRNNRIQMIGRGLTNY